MSIRPAFRLSCLVSALPLLAACGGDGKDGGTSPSPGGSLPTRASGGTPASGEGSLIISKPEGLVEYNIKSGREKPLITPDAASTFILDPAISPDGERIVYIVQPPPTITNICDAATPTPPPGTARGAAVASTTPAPTSGWRIATAATRTSSITHAQPNQLVRFPQWQDDDTILFVAQEIAVVNGVTTVSYVLERIAGGGGARTRVIEDVLGVRIVAGSQAAGLRAAGAADRRDAERRRCGRRERGDAGRHRRRTSAPFNVPRYSPDGTKIAFASADQTGARAHR